MRSPAPSLVTSEGIQIAVQPPIGSPASQVWQEVPQLLGCATTAFDASCTS